MLRLCFVVGVFVVEESTCDGWSMVPSVVASLE